MRRLRGLGHGVGALAWAVALAPIPALLAAAALDRGPDGAARWALFPAALTAFDPYVWESARNSLVLAAAVTLAARIIGVGLARVAVRWRFLGRAPLVALAGAVVVVPPAFAAAWPEGIIRIARELAHHTRSAVARKRGRSSGLVLGRAADRRAGGRLGRGQCLEAGRPSLGRRRATCGRTSGTSLATRRLAGRATGCGARARARLHLDVARTRRAVGPRLAADAGLPDGFLGARSRCRRDVARGGAGGGRGRAGDGRARVDWLVGRLYRLGESSDPSGFATVSSLVAARRSVLRTVVACRNRGVDAAGRGWSSPHSGPTPFERSCKTH